MNRGKKEYIEMKQLCKTNKTSKHAVSLDQNDLTEPLQSVPGVNSLKEMM